MLGGWSQAQDGGEAVCSIGDGAVPLTVFVWTMNHWRRSINPAWAHLPTGRAARPARLRHLLRTGGQELRWRHGDRGMQDRTCPLDGGSALQPAQPPQTLEKGEVRAGRLAFLLLQDTWGQQL